jgi:CheY-specific phosphatase CheX
MQVELVDVFIEAAVAVLRKETGGEVSHGAVRVLSSAQTSEDVTAMFGVMGDVRGMVLLGTSERTARAIVAHRSGAPCPLFDEPAQSGVAELMNVIAARAVHDLQSAGHRVKVTSPTLVAGGPGIVISTVNFRRFVVLLHTTVGDLVLHAAVDRAPGVHRPTEARQLMTIPA